MSWNTIIVNAIVLMMSLYCVKSVLNGLIMLKQSLKKYVHEFKPVVSCKRWKMNKRKNQSQENKYVYINFDYRIDVEFQYKHD